MRLSLVLEHYMEQSTPGSGGFISQQLSFLVSIKENLSFGGFHSWQLSIWISTEQNILGSEGLLFTLRASEHRIEYAWQWQIYATW